MWEAGTIRASSEVFVAEPAIVIDPESAAVHHIDSQWLREHGLTPADAVERIEMFLRKDFGALLGSTRVSVAGHNVDFDVTFLKRLYRLAGREYGRTFSHRHLDTASVLRFLSIAGYLPLESAASNDAFEYFQIPFDEVYRRHSALGDARAAALLFTKLLDILPHRTSVTA